MSSPSESISPGNASERTEPRPRPGVRQSLWRDLAWAFAPLCAVAVVGMTVVTVDARHVHRDLQRMFEEMREVSLSRALLDELRGIEQWVDAVPEGRAGTHALAFADVRRHLEDAKATLARYGKEADPSVPEHDEEEDQSTARIVAALDAVEAGLGADSTLAELRKPLELAVHGTKVLSDTVAQETREIGTDLDRRSSRLTEFVLVLAVAIVGTLAWLGSRLRSRVLVPLRELQLNTAMVAHGRQPRPMELRHDDEVARLASAFDEMARQVRNAREDLEQRVEQRSREVLRTARLAELGTLSAGIAHEVNNPIASIAACAEGLLRDLDKGKGTDERHQREYLEIIRKEAMRTRDITARLLGFARQDVRSSVAVALGDELREVSAMFGHQFESAGVRLAIDAAPAEATVTGDPAELRQVLFNLFRNALDASPRGATVDVGLAVEDGTAVLEFSDRGPGIRPEDMERIFEPFFTTKAPGKGTGLGLAIVHRIVTGHGGRITAANREGGGACFRVSLPLV
ncbi:MAG: hypothetical protein RL148_697 [Planctomycetota bacterium]